MRIITQTLKRFEKIINAFYTKGDMQTESIFFDFEDGYIYAKNFNYILRIKFDFEVEDNEKDKFLLKRFVDVPTFLSICNSYEFLDIDQDFSFSYKNEKFRIPTFEGNFDKTPFEVNDTSWNSYSLSNIDIKNIEKASGYGSISESELMGVSLNKNNIIATDKIKLFRAKTDSYFDNVRLPLTILKFISLGYTDLFLPSLTKELREDILHGKSLPTSIIIKTDGSKSIISVNDSQFEVVFPENTEMEFINYDDPEFIKNFNHSDFFVFEKQTMLEILKFFQPFVKSNPVEKLLISVLDKDKLNIIVQEGEINANRILPLKICSDELIGKSMWVSRIFLNQALKTIHDDFISVQMNENSPAINISGEIEKDNNVVIVKIIKMEQ